MACIAGGHNAAVALALISDRVHMIVSCRAMELDRVERLHLYASELQGRPPKPGQTLQRFKAIEGMTAPGDVSIRQYNENAIAIERTINTAQQ